MKRTWMVNRSRSTWFGFKIPILASCLALALPLWSACKLRPGAGLSGTTPSGKGLADHLPDEPIPDDVRQRLTSLFNDHPLGRRAIESLPGAFVGDHESGSATQPIAFFLQPAIGESEAFAWELAGEISNLQNTSLRGGDGVPSFWLTVDSWAPGSDQGRADDARALGSDFSHILWIKSVDQSSQEITFASPSGLGQSADAAFPLRANLGRIEALLHQSFLVRSNAEIRGLLGVFSATDPAVTAAAENAARDEKAGTSSSARGGGWEFLNWFNRFFQRLGDRGHPGYEVTLPGATAAVPFQIDPGAAPQQGDSGLMTTVRRETRATESSEPSGAQWRRYFLVKQPARSLVERFRFFVETLFRRAAAAEKGWAVLDVHTDSSLLPSDLGSTASAQVAADARGSEKVISGLVPRIPVKIRPRRPSGGFWPGYSGFLLPAPAVRLDQLGERSVALLRSIAFTGEAPGGVFTARDARDARDVEALLIALRQSFGIVQSLAKRGVCHTQFSPQTLGLYWSDGGVRVGLSSPERAVPFGAKVTGAPQPLQDGPALFGDQTCGNRTDLESWLLLLSSSVGHLPLKLLQHTSAQKASSAEATSGKQSRNEVSADPLIALLNDPAATRILPADRSPELSDLARANELFGTLVRSNLDRNQSRLVGKAAGAVALALFALADFIESVGTGLSARSDLQSSDVSVLESAIQAIVNKKSQLSQSEEEVLRNTAQAFGQGGT